MTAHEPTRKKILEHFGFGTEQMKKIKICKKCGAAVSADEDYCTLCREKLPENTLFDVYRQRHRTCPGCKTVLTDGALFCPECGKRVQTEGGKINE